MFSKGRVYQTLSWFSNILCQIDVQISKLALLKFVLRKRFMNSSRTRMWLSLSGILNDLISEFSQLKRSRSDSDVAESACPLSRVGQDVVCVSTKDTIELGSV